MAKKSRKASAKANQAKASPRFFRTRDGDHPLEIVNMGKPSPRSKPKPTPAGGYPTLLERRQTELAAKQTTRQIFGATARASLDEDLPAPAIEPAPRAAPARAGGRFPSLAERVAREGVMAQYKGGRPGQLPGTRKEGDDDGQ